MRGLPHPRGDGPVRDCLGVPPAVSPPPAWGWTPAAGWPGQDLPVSPTRVGMDLASPSSTCIARSLPHPRGDGPAFAYIETDRSGSPPPAWGWTLPGGRLLPPARVSPTRVGMDPVDYWRGPTGYGLPHPRGDGPDPSGHTHAVLKSPPPAWGWTRHGVDDARHDLVSPTRVGMDPTPQATPPPSRRLPHPRGDGPPDLVGKLKPGKSPPPAWGWTPGSRREAQAGQVSPTRVGMDPRIPPRPRPYSRLPHPRGDGPGAHRYLVTFVTSPPPAWGWTRHRAAEPAAAVVSPTRVGMDP